MNTWEEECIRWQGEREREWKREPGVVKKWERKNEKVWVRERSKWVRNWDCVWKSESIRMRVGRKSSWGDHVQLIFIFVYLLFIESD